MPRAAATGAIRGGDGGEHSTPSPRRVESVPLPTLVVQPSEVPPSAFSPALTAIQKCVAPLVLIDNPGKGSCGAYATGLALGLPHAVVRRRIVHYMSSDAGRARVLDDGGDGETATLAAFAKSSLAQWTSLEEEERTVDKWCELMALPTTYFDDVSLVALADLEAVRIVVHNATMRGGLPVVNRPVVFEPASGSSPRLTVVVACELDVHFVAVAQLADGPAVAPIRCNPHRLAFAVPPTDADSTAMLEAMRHSLTPTRAEQQFERATAVAIQRSLRPRGADPPPKRQRPSSLDLIFAHASPASCSSAPPEAAPVIFNAADELIAVGRHAPADFAVQASLQDQHARDTTRTLTSSLSTLEQPMNLDRTCAICCSFGHVDGSECIACSGSGVHDDTFSGDPTGAPSLGTPRLLANALLNSMAPPPPPPPPPSCALCGSDGEFCGDPCWCQAGEQSEKRVTFGDAEVRTFDADAEVHARRGASGGARDGDSHPRLRDALTEETPAPAEVASDPTVFEPAEGEDEAQLAAAEMTSFSWPLTTIEEVIRLLACTHIAPTDLVGFEFSASMRSALEAAGRRALSVDTRPSEKGGMHACLDVRLVIPLRRWERAFFFPPCYQQLRADADCLPLKISDGRAFWGCALVIFCLCAPADLLVVEQPDTIVADFYAYPHVELRSSAFGDTLSKFIRLGIRNGSLVPPAHSLTRDPASAPLPVSEYADPDERDRCKSTWAHFPALCAALAALQPLDRVSTPLRYEDEIRHFAAAWQEAGYPIPEGYDDPSALPPTPEARAYQEQRGPGDGRAAAAPSTLLVAPGDASATYELAVPLPFDLVPPPTPPPSPPPTPSAIRGGGDVELPAEVLKPEDGQPPTVDVRTATEATVLLLFICVLGQPLVYAHLNGFTVYGATMPERLPRSRCLAAAQGWSELVCETVHHALMVGEYVGGARLIATPVAFAPIVGQVCRTRTQRRSWLAAGTAFAWCTLAALTGSPIADAAARALVATEAFVKPVAMLADFASAGTLPALEFRAGASPATSMLRRPYLDGEESPPAWRALAHAERSGKLLRERLNALSDDPLLAGWVDRISPFDPADVPPDLLASLPDFRDERLDDVLFTPVPPPLVTAWLPLPPRQPPAPPGAPACVRSAAAMLLPWCAKRVDRWLNSTLHDLVHIRDALAAGTPAAAIRRDRPPPLAVGQECLLPWAQGIVWDCRLRCCVPLDFHAPAETHLNLDFIRRRLHDYPDQHLLANLLEGVRLDADVELHSVFVPHLTSLPLGFASVQKEVNRLHGLGWYAFFQSFAFWPLYLNGQGAAARKLEPDRYRRTTEGGGPRQETADESGLAALSINTASHLPHTPRHFASDQRPAFRAWLADRGLPRDLETDPLGSKPNEQLHSKWPKERKPTLTELMRDLVILCRAAALLSEPIYVMGDDAKDYFNQLAMATPELPKLNIVFLDDAVPADLPPRLRFISELRLGFGTHGASNIAQRFSDALLHLFREDMDRIDAPFLPDRWRQARASAQRTSASKCFSKDGVEICPEYRLYTAYMYTDDNFLCAVGVERTIRMLRTWRQLTNNLNLLMAIPEKRALGTWCMWLGVLIIAALGIVVVPRDKLLRAGAAIESLLTDGLEFHTYRSLCGLLEHLRAVNLRGRNVMHGLYRPHGPGGESSDGPTAVVRCDPLMTKQIQRWRLLLTQSAGVSVKMALARRDLETPPSLWLAVCGDACHGDGDPTGLGGYCHGRYWYFRVPEGDLPVVTIPVLEFLAACFNILAFWPLIRGFAGAGSTGIILRTDALTTAFTLPNETEKSDALIEAFQWLEQRPEFIGIRPHCSVMHIFGDCNAFSDAISRARWPAFHQLCAQVGVRPTQAPLPSAALELYQHVMGFLRTRPPRLRAGGVHGCPSFLDRARGVSAPPPSTVPATAAPPNGSALPPLSFLVRTGQASTPPTPAPSFPRLTAEGLSFPTPDAGRSSMLIPQRDRQSRLGAASQHYLRARAASLATGGEPDMQLGSHLAALSDAVASIEDVVDFGVNANTARIDERAWEMWEFVCEQQGTNPLRSPSEVRDYPDRQAHLLACLLLHAFTVGKPRDATRKCIKPKSAMAYPLAIIRVFARWGITMPGYRMLVSATNGLSRLYLRYHGEHSLSPRRAEPMRFAMVSKINAIPLDGRHIGPYVWSDSNHRVFMFRRLNRFLIRTGFRLGEIVAHTSGEVMFLTRASVYWRIDGVWHRAPSRTQLLGMQPGRDGCSVTPPRSKPDQWGEIHCPFTIFLVLHNHPEDACAAVRDIELTCPVPEDARETTALFGDERGEPYSHGVLDPVLRFVLTYLYGTKIASIYSWHSYRSGLATMLYAAKVPDAVIMLMCRWMCEASLHIYRRIGTAEHESNFRRAMTANVDAIQSANVPTVVGDQNFAQLLNDLNNKQDRASFVDSYAAALRGDAAAAAPAAAPAARAAPAAARQPPPSAPRASPAPILRNPAPIDPANAVGRTVCVAAGLSTAATRTVAQAGRPSSSSAPDAPPSSVLRMRAPLMDGHTATSASPSATSRQCKNDKLRTPRFASPSLPRPPSPTPMQWGLPCAAARAPTGTAWPELADHVTLRHAFCDRLAAGWTHASS